MTKKRSGYSVLELLIVVTLVAILALTATSFLFTTLSGTGKASSLAIVKQNGDHAIGVIERAARGSLAVVCPTAATLMVSTDAGNTTYAIVASRIAATDLSGTIYLTSDRIVAENFSCSITVGTQSIPDIATVSFRLRLGNPSTDEPEKVAMEQFQTRVTLRTY